MFRYTCLNPIAQTGLDGFSENYQKTEELNDADAILVRSAKMHEMELPKSVCAIARAGAGVNMQTRVLLCSTHRVQMPTA